MDDLKRLAPDIRRLIASELASGVYADEQDVLRQALSILAERRETIAGVRRGLADVEAGRVQPLDDYEREFRRRHRLPEASGESPE